MPNNPVNAPIISEIPTRARGEIFRSAELTGAGTNMETPAVIRTNAKPVKTRFSGI